MVERGPAVRQDRATSAAAGRAAIRACSLWTAGVLEKPAVDGLLILPPGRAMMPRRSGRGSVRGHAEGR